MKKSLLIVAIAAFALSSCKKTHTCECKDSAGVVTTYPLVKSTKSQAKTLCDAYSYGGETCTVQ